MLRDMVARWNVQSRGLPPPGKTSLTQFSACWTASAANHVQIALKSGRATRFKTEVRDRVERRSPITGLPETYTGTTQATSLYSLHRPAAYCEHLPMPPARPTPFPPRRQLELLERMELLWSVKPSLERRMKPTSPTHQIANLMRPFTGAR